MRKLGKPGSKGFPGEAILSASVSQSLSGFNALNFCSIRGIFNALAIRPRTGYEAGILRSQYIWGPQIGQGWALVPEEPAKQSSGGRNARHSCKQATPSVHRERLAEGGNGGTCFIDIPPSQTTQGFTGFEPNARDTHMQGSLLRQLAPRCH